MPASGVVCFFGFLTVLILGRFRFIGFPLRFHCFGMIRGCFMVCTVLCAVATVPFGVGFVPFVVFASILLFLDG